MASVATHFVHKNELYAVDYSPVRFSILFDWL